jgi:hypothetical protein
MVVVCPNGGVYFVRRLILSKNFQITCLYICISFGQSISFIVKHVYLLDVHRYFIIWVQSQSNKPT